MIWAGIAAFLVAGGVIAYQTGFDEIIYRTIMNFGASFFTYILIKIMDLFSWLLDLFPDVPEVQHYSGAIQSLLTFLVRANTFFPVIEVVFMFGFMVLFITIFFCVKIILKLIPTIG
jgi:hypothetical protein